LKKFTKLVWRNIIVIKPLFKISAFIITITTISISIVAASGNAVQTTFAREDLERDQPEVIFPTHFDTSAPLRDLVKKEPLLPDIDTLTGKEYPLYERKLPVPESSVEAMHADLLLSNQTTTHEAVNTNANFEGINYSQGGRFSKTGAPVPPDTNGDIGPNHYIQIVNITFAIFDRAGNLLLGPNFINTIWNGFGGACQTSNDGDPIVLYDQLADRWLISQFALPDPYYQCIAISQSGDPTGAWHRYAYQISSSEFNDYPKFGVWSDAYYMSANNFDDSTMHFTSIIAAAFERDQMLAGNTARMVKFRKTNSDLYSLLPANLEGTTLPLNGTPNPFVEMEEGNWYDPPISDRLQIWEFHVDWSNTANSSFNHKKNLTTAAFDANMCGGSRNCIPQPGGRNLSAISDRLMYRLAYRNFGDHQSIVVNHTIDTNGNDHAGIRWYELRDNNDGNSWNIFQQGTFAPDADHRWMGSVSINKRGDIALGYSVSSANTFPSIRFTGRYATDPLDTMPVAESNVVSGGGFQQTVSHRWGDYSAMSVDPADDCTFWYTQEYYAASSDRGWQTRIASFKLRDCEQTTKIYQPYQAEVISINRRIKVFVDVDNVQKVEISIDNQAWIDITSNFDGVYYYYDWDTSGLNQGSHTIQATVTTSSAGVFNASPTSVTISNNSTFLPFTVK
jgi:hypothetical protein